jgi:hypothetical protein
MSSLRQELRLKLKIKKLERNSRTARDIITKKLNSSEPNKYTKTLLNAIQDKNDKEYSADGCECFIT